MTDIKCGSLTVYAGPMYAGKSSALIAELEASLEESKRVIVIKPSIDNRYSLTDIVSHDGISLTATTGHKVKLISPEEVLTLSELIETDLLLVDEAQFFSNLGEVVCSYLEHGIDVITVGLDLDSEGKPFGCMPHLLSLATNIYKLTGICSVCGEEATRTFRKLSAVSSSQVLIGGSETYEPRCMFHWLEGQQEKKRFFS